MIESKTKTNLITALMIILSFAISLMIYTGIIYSIHKGYLKETTSTLGYIVTSLAVGFIIVWFPFRLKNKEKK